MSSTDISAFNLPDHLMAKADPALIGDDEAHFAAIARSLAETIADLDERLEVERKAPGRSGQAALERDQEVYRLTSRLRALRRFGLDLCLGRIVGTDDPEPVYVGRLGLADSAGRRLLIDWRSPAAAPFFAATHASTMGLRSRRRYRWTQGRVTDYWDEAFTADVDDRAALDDHSAFVASLGASRSPQMRDVLATIQSDQDAIIRAGSSGALVVDGGPGTGKTVVALHRAAYLLYSDPRLRNRRGGVLFVGPHHPYLAYVADVLPSLGEEGVQICTLRDLVAQGADASVEPDPEVAALKSSVGLVGAIEAAVAFYEEPPTKALLVETPRGAIRLTPADWAEAFGEPAPGTAHNDARDEVWEAVLSILVDKADVDVTDDADVELRRALVNNRDFVAAFARAWPLLDAADIVADLWSVPAYLHRCAPWLSREQIQRLQRQDPSAWTVPDLPLLDAARRRLGDPGAAHRKRRRDAAIAAGREQMATVVDDLIASDDSELLLMSMLRGDDLQAALDDVDAVPVTTPDALAGPFAHVVVDEAQELSDAEWQMVLARCPAQSLTIVGDRAQARHGFAETWQHRLERVGVERVTMAGLTVNYRTPVEIMTEAEPVIRAVLSDANVPTSIRSSGIPVEHRHVSELFAILDRWSAESDGTACVIGDPAFRSTARVRALTPELSKGLEFDLVVLVDPQAFGAGIVGAVDRYVAMTRATQRLVILTS